MMRRTYTSSISMLVRTRATHLPYTQDIDYVDRVSRGPQMNLSPPSRTSHVALFTSTADYHRAPCVGMRVKRSRVSPRAVRRPHGALRFLKWLCEATAISGQSDRPDPASRGLPSGDRAPRRRRD